VTYAAIGRIASRLHRSMKRRAIFPLRLCPGLVPIRELDDDIVIVVVERRARGDERRPTIPVDYAGITQAPRFS
jgi:hypothetical protein